MRALEPCTHSQKIDAFAVLSYNDKKKSHKLAFPTKSPPKFEHPYPLGVVSNNEYNIFFFIQSRKTFFSTLLVLEQSKSK